MNTRFLLLPILALLLIFSACDRNVDLSPIPEDQDPVITLADAGRTQILRLVGSTATINLRLGDNESLSRLRVTESVFDQDSTLLVADKVFDDIDLSLQEPGIFTYPYNYSVMSTVQGVTLDNYYRIRLTFYAIDSKGASSSTTIDIDILPDPQGPPVYDLRSYTGVRLSHPNMFDNKSAYNFDANNFATIDLNQDILIVDATPSPLTAKTFSSPANTRAGFDTAVFVIVTPDKLNFDEVNHRIIEQAFFSAAQYYNEAPIGMMNEGDMLITRMTKTFNRPVKHYSVLKINELVSGGAPSDQYILFDYKVSTD